MTTVLAIDLGASSGRVILLTYGKGKIFLEEVHRFSDYLMEESQKYVWDFPKILTEIRKGIKKAAKIRQFDSIGIDTWGVDFGLLDAEGRLLENPICYRSWSSLEIIDEINQILELKELYLKTGTQILPINTLFQLIGLSKDNPEIIKRAKTLLFIPDLINYFLTNEIRSEITEASTSQMLNQNHLVWAQGIIQKLNISNDLLPPLVFPKEKIGDLIPEIASECCIDRKPIIAVGSHDTASAIFSIPYQLDDVMFISSGTWSLLGVSLPDPLITPWTYKCKLSNEIGVDCHLLLDNISGLWLIQELKKYSDKNNQLLSFDEINQKAQQSLSEPFYFDVNAEIFLKPNSLIENFRKISLETNQKLPRDIFGYARIIYENLAYKYRLSYEKMIQAGIEPRKKIVIIGGGSQASFLCQLTADIIQLPVYAGLSEATAIGNGLCQLFALGKISQKEKANDYIKESFEMIEYLPNVGKKIFYEKRYKEYLKINK